MKRLLLITTFLFTSCTADTFRFSVINNTGYESEITIPEYKIQWTVEPSSAKMFRFRKSTMHFSFFLNNATLSKEFDFYDKDHWFSMTHKINIIIDEKGVSVKGARNESIVSPEE